MIDITAFHRGNRYTIAGGGKGGLYQFARKEGAMKRSYLFSLFCALLLGCLRPLTSQAMNVVTVIPEDGSVNVDTSATISLTLGKVLGKPGVHGGDVKLEALFFPEALSEGKPLLSDDGKTISMSVRLAANTVYRLTIFQAWSKTGYWLTEPVAITFSTGVELPAGSISGHITNASGLGDRVIFVALLDSTGRLSNPARVKKDGSYQLSYLSDGAYYVLSSTVDLRENEYKVSSIRYDNGVFQKQTMSQPAITEKTYFAYYGWDGAAEDSPDVVTVSGEGAVAGIDMTVGATSIMKLLSFSPTDGEVNVPADDASLSLTFNLPIAVPEDEEERREFFEETFQLLLVPSGENADSPALVFSDFGRTITLTGTLAENTYHTAALLRAVDYLGSSASEEHFTFLNPTVFGFSTGSSLPAASVSGMVTLPNKNVDYAAVGLAANNPFRKNDDESSGHDNKDDHQVGKQFESLLRGEYMKVAGQYTGDDNEHGEKNTIRERDGEKENGGLDVQVVGLVDAHSGIYSLRAPGGTYWPLAYTTIPAGSCRMEKMGFFDPDGDGIPDSIVVQDESIEDIDIIFNVPRAIHLTGIIRDERNKPVTGAEISIHSGQWRDQTQSNQGGVYKFRNIPAGKYTLEINPPQEANLQSKIMELEIGERPVVLNITLQSSEPHYNVDSTAAGSYPIIVTGVNFEGIGIEPGDEIAVKIISGGLQRNSKKEVEYENVVGAAALADSFPVIIMAWADDPETAEKKEGFAVGDTILFEVYKSRLDREFPAFAVYSEGDGKFGTGAQSQVSLSVRRPKCGEKIEQLVQNPRVPVRTVFEDNSVVEVEFKSGMVSNVKVEMKSLGTAIPETGQVRQRIQRAAAFFEVEAAVQDTFTATLTLGYSESMLTAAGINETELIIAFYDTVSGEWKALTTQVDVIKKLASASTRHFSLWSLADKNDTIITGVQESGERALLPQEYKLHQNYPNPFNPATTIRYELKTVSRVTLTVYNLIGQKVRTLMSGTMPAGVYEVAWDGKSDAGMPVASGIYFYGLRAGGYVSTRKMILVR